MSLLASLMTPTHQPTLGQRYVDDPQCWCAGVCAGCDGIALNLSNEEQEHGRQADSDDSSALHAETGSEARSEVATVRGTTVGPTSYCTVRRGSTFGSLPSGANSSLEMVGGLQTTLNCYCYGSTTVQYLSMYSTVTHWPRGRKRQAGVRLGAKRTVKPFSPVLLMVVRECMTCGALMGRVQYGMISYRTY